MAEEVTESDSQFWETHCWSRRFYGQACKQPATWRGSEDSDSGFVRAWRACDDHRLRGDVPLYPGTSDPS